VLSSSQPSQCGRRRDVCWRITSMAILGHILVNDGRGLHDIRKGIGNLWPGAIADVVSGSQRILRRLDPLRF